MFDIGDKVVHPTHWAGQVMGIKEQDLLEQYHRYYVINLAVDDRTLMIPVSNAKEIGLRSISREAALSKVWRTLSGAGESLSDDYKKRQKRVQKVTTQPLSFRATERKPVLSEVEGRSD